MWLHDAAVCWHSPGLIQFALRLVQIPDFAIDKSSSYHDRASSIFYGWCDIGGCSSFTNSSPCIDPLIWDDDFELHRSKGLCSTVLLSNLCAPEPIEAFWQFFASTTVVSWQQFFHIGQLHRVFSAQWMLTHLFHDFGSVVQWCLEK